MEVVQERCGARWAVPCNEVGVEMPSDKDIVEEARVMLAHPDVYKYVGADARRVLHALADEVERLRGLVRHMNLPPGE